MALLVSLNNCNFFVVIAILLMFSLSVSARPSILTAKPTTSFVIDRYHSSEPTFVHEKEHFKLALQLHERRNYRLPELPPRSALHKKDHHVSFPVLPRAPVPPSGPSNPPRSRSALHKKDHHVRVFPMLPRGDRIPPSGPSNPPKSALQDKEHVRVFPMLPRGCVNSTIGTVKTSTELNQPCINH